MPGTSAEVKCPLVCLLVASWTWCFKCSEISYMVTVGTWSLCQELQWKSVGIHLYDLTAEVQISFPLHFIGPIRPTPSPVNEGNGKEFVDIYNYKHITKNSLFFFYFLKLLFPFQGTNVSFFPFCMNILFFSFIFLCFSFCIHTTFSC